MSKKRRYFWNRDKVIAEVQRLKRRDVPLYNTYIITARGDLYAAAYVYCGSWREAVEAAGFDYLEESARVTTAQWLQALSGDDVQKLEAQLLHHAEERRQHVHDNRYRGARRHSRDPHREDS